MSEELAVIFADITGSTRLYESLGDETAKRIIGLCISELSCVTEKHKGTVIKTIGDEVMCTFPNIAYGTQAAGDMHVAIRTAFEDSSEPVDSMHITVGLHAGPVIHDDGDVYGDTVNVAARMNKLAKADQTIISGDALNMLPAALRMGSRYVDKTAVKGKAEAMEVFELMWEVEGATMMADTAPKRSTVEYTTLQLMINGEPRSLRGDELPVVLGRSDDADITVPNSWASRAHATLEYSGGRFALVDQSVNGTFYTDPDGKESKLRRDRWTLQKTGKISLGQPASDAPDMVIEFSCE